MHNLHFTTDIYYLVCENVKTTVKLYITISISYLARRILPANNDMCWCVLFSTILLRLLWLCIDTILNSKHTTDLNKI